MKEEGDGDLFSHNSELHSPCDTGRDGLKPHGFCRSVPISRTSDIPISARVVIAEYRPCHCDVNRPPPMLDPLVSRPKEPCPTC
jgi:hypothetical protein